MRIVAITLNTAREIIRDRVLYAILIFGIILIFSIRLIAPMSLGEELRIIRDFGLSIISILGILVTIFIGTRLLYDEIQRKTIYTVIPKSVRRWEFILGKYMGVALALLFVTVVLGLGFIFYMLVFKLPITANIFKTILLEYIELMLVSAIAIFFSTFASPIGSGIFTFVMYFIGHFTRDILIFGKMTRSALIEFIAANIYYFLPNLSYFNTRAEAVHDLSISIYYLFFSVSYGLIYVIVILCIAVLFFEKKDL